MFLVVVTGLPGVCHCWSRHHKMEVGRVGGPRDNCQWENYKSEGHDENCPGFIYLYYCLGYSVHHGWYCSSHGQFWVHHVWGEIFSVYVSCASWQFNVIHRSMKRGIRKRVLTTMHLMARKKLTLKREVKRMRNGRIIMFLLMNQKKRSVMNKKMWSKFWLQRVINQSALVVHFVNTLYGSF